MFGKIDVAGRGEQGVVDVVALARLARDVELDGNRPRAARAPVANEAHDASSSVIPRIGIEIQSGRLFSS